MTENNTEKPKRRGRPRKNNQTSSSKIKRDLTTEESLAIIEKYSENFNFFLNIKNHKKFNKMKNTFRFTADVVSINFLFELMKDRMVLNVFFSPSTPPPGMGIDGTSMRYKLYVQYKQKEE